MDRSQQQIQSTLDLELRDNLPLLFMLGMLVFVSLAVVNFYALGFVPEIAFANLSSAAVCGMLTLCCVAKSIPVHWANLLLAVGVLLLLYNTIVRIWIVTDGIGQYSYFVLLSLLMNRLGWFLGLLAIGIVSLAMTALFLVPAPSDASVLSSTVIGTLAALIVYFFRHKATIKRIEVEIKLDLVRNEHDLLLHQLRVANDQRDAATKRLRSANGVFEELVYKSPVPMLIHENGEVVFANGPICELYEEREASLRGKNIHDLLRPENISWFSLKTGVATKIDLVTIGGLLERIASNIPVSMVGESTFLLIVKNEPALGDVREILSESGDEFDTKNVVAKANRSAVNQRLPLRVMIAEDNAVNMEVICAMVDLLGHKIVCRAANGAEILQEIDLCQPDLLLLDLSMPVLDGFNTVKKLRQNAKWDTLPMIAVSAHADLGSRKQAMAVGFDRYIEKPIDFDNLKRELEGSQRG